MCLAGSWAEQLLDGARHYSNNDALDMIANQSARFIITIHMTPPP
jgi:hypothetical protein